MTVRDPRLSHVLSGCVVLLMVTASSAGLLVPTLYRDNVLVSSGWYGNDLVSLLVAAPILCAAMLLARRGSSRAMFVWMGMLGYALCNSGFYLFGAAFNSLFLVYVGQFTIAGYALLFGLASLDVEWRISRPPPTLAHSGVSVYMFVVGLMLGGFHIALALNFVFAGTVPSVVKAVGHTTNVIAALDLSIVVPLMVVGALWLWKGEPWGYVVAVMTNVLGAVYMTALCAATLSAVLKGAADSLAQLALWGEYRARLPRFHLGTAR